MVILDNMTHADMHTIMYGPPTVDMVNMLSAINNANTTVFAGMSDRHRIGIENHFQANYSYDAMERARMIAGSFANAAMNNREMVYPIDPDNYVPPVDKMMINSIMSAPIFRKAVRDGLMAGFPDLYIDSEPDEDDEYRADYLCSIEGNVLETKVAPSNLFVVMDEVNPVFPADREVITDNWRMLYEMYIDDETDEFDPTESIDIK